MSFQKAAVFQDTRKYFAKEPFASAIKESKKGNVILHTPEQMHRLGQPKKRSSSAQIILSGKGSFEAARTYAGNRQVAVLNFASYTQPGGGVEAGVRTQEESLCRCSTLFAVINSRYMHEYFYNHSVRYLTEGWDIFQCEVLHKCRYYSSALSYAPDILVFKDDKNGNPLLEEKDRFLVDVITSAAPRIPKALRGKLSETQQKALFNVYCERAEMILGTAARKHADVLILGAYGCGAFNNPPELVAKAFAQVTQKYKDCFETVEYAIYPGARSSNYQVFKNVLQGKIDNLKIEEGA